MAREFSLKALAPAAHHPADVFYAFAERAIASVGYKRQLPRKLHEEAQRVDIFYRP